MAITVTNINKIQNGVYSVTVQDSLDGDQQHTIKYNMADAASVLEAKIKNIIEARKALISDEEAVETKIKTLIEAIDTTKITAEKE